MDLSTKVNIVLCILSFVLAAVSVITVIITLRQNNRMIAESTRPYITIFLDAITICEQTSYFVLKNFGHCAATITRFEYDKCLKTTKQKSILNQEQFDCILGITLAPGQSKLLEYPVSTLNKDILTFVIGYTTLGKYYEETIEMNVKHFIHIPAARPESFTDINMKRQANTLREIVERLI